MNKDELIFNLKLLSDYENGLSYSEIAEQTKLSLGSVYNRIRTAKRYQSLYKTDFWNEFESIGADPINILSIFTAMSNFIIFRCTGNEFRNNPHIQNYQKVASKRYSAARDIHQESDLELSFIKSITNDELLSLRSVPQISNLRYNYIKRVHDS